MEGTYVRNRFPAWMAIMAAALVLLAAPVEAASWLPPSADDLRLTAEAQAPKAAAIILYRQVDRDDNDDLQRSYLRAKILTEEGRQYANVQLAYDNRWETIRDIEARTIQPDGSVAEFHGTIYDRQLAEGQGVNYRAKVFALPDVQVGSIIEYRFTQTFGNLFNSQWVLSEPLFTRDAKFSLQPNRKFSLRYSWPQGLPEGTGAPAFSSGAIRLEAHNIPAFIKEDHMPPESELRYRVDFIYVAPGEDERDPTIFWAKFGKKRDAAVENFVDDRRVLTQALAQIVAPDDPPEKKLRKIYARVQQIRNLSFEPRRSEQEKEREHLHDLKDAADVWQRGYGSAEQIDWLLLGLVRAAGFHADAVVVANRDAVFFKTGIMNPGQLNTSLVRVSEGGRDFYLDPGAAFTPFGMLPWGKTGVRGLALDKDGGRWIDTPLPAPADSRIERHADLNLSGSGALTGRVTLTLTGLEARTCRVHERYEDDTHRRQYLENLLKIDVPGASEVTLTNDPEWTDAQSLLVAEYTLTIQDWVTLTGQRALLPIALFTGRWRHVFEHATRIHPIYFPFPFEYVDDVRIGLPRGWAPFSLPNVQAADVNVLGYQSSAAFGEGTLQLRRTLTSKVTLLDAKYYDTVRDFFQNVRTGDGAQLILSAAAPVATAAPAGQR